MTVGELRKLIADLPDAAVIRPQWNEGEEPQGSSPGVVLHGFDFRDGELLARVGLFWLDDIVDDCEWEITIDGDSVSLNALLPNTTTVSAKEVSDES